MYTYRSHCSTGARLAEAEAVDEVSLVERVARVEEVVAVQLAVHADALAQTVQLLALALRVQVCARLKAYTGSIRCRMLTRRMIDATQ